MHRVLSMQIIELDSTKILGTVGEPADRSSYTEWLRANMSLYALQNEMTLSTAGSANWIRSSMATNLRKRMTQCNMLLGGYDADEGSASLYFCDYLATLHKMPFACHGHASSFILSIFDREWRPNMSLDEAKVVMGKCIAELHKRFMISQPNFMIKVVDKDGVRVLEQE